MSDSDKPVPVFEYTRTFVTTTEEYMGERIHFTGEPGRYVRVEDAIRLAREACYEGFETADDEENCLVASEAWDSSQTAARLRAMMGE